MRIAIADDHQDVIDKLACYSLIRHHQVTRWREPARDLASLAARLADAEILVLVRERVAITSALLERLPQLRLIALVGRRSSVLDLAACTEHGIMVATGASHAPEPTAEHAVALIVAARRKIAVDAEGMKRGGWPGGLAYRLRGSTLGVYGLGRIGELVAESCAGLGMKILVWGREGTLAKARAAGYEAAADKDDFFGRADVLSLHLRLNDETGGIVGPEDLARMKPSALLVNTGRAGLIRPGALVAALQAGRPGFAAVDVYEHEPVLDGDHPLLRLPNALCTPHAAWADWDNFELDFTECFEQIVAFETGGTLRLANPEVTPRRQ